MICYDIYGHHETFILWRHKTELIIDVINITFWYNTCRIHLGYAITGDTPLDLGAIWAYQ